MLCNMAKRNIERTASTAAESAAAPAEIDAERIITEAQLLERIPLDRSTIWRMVRDGKFPAPIQLTSSRKGWRWSSVPAWLAEREANPVGARSYFGREKTAARSPSRRRTASAPTQMSAVGADR